MKKIILLIAALFCLVAVYAQTVVKDSTFYLQEAKKCKIGKYTAFSNGSYSVHYDTIGCDDRELLQYFSTYISGKVRELNADAKNSIRRSEAVTDLVRLNDQIIRESGISITDMLGKELAPFIKDSTGWEILKDTFASGIKFAYVSGLLKWESDTSATNARAENFGILLRLYNFNSFASLDFWLIDGEYIAAGTPYKIKRTKRARSIPIIPSISMPPITTTEPLSSIPVVFRKCDGELQKNGTVLINGKKFKYKKGKWVIQ